MKFHPLAVLVTALALHPISVDAQSSPKSLQGPVILESQPDIGKGIHAFPRVQSNDAVPPAIAAKINASLQRLDRNVRSAASDCKQQFQENQHRRSVDGWLRTISPTMRGPSFLSIQADDSVYCGGAHPDDETLSMVYELSSGRPVDWTKILPAEAEGVTDEGADGTTIGLITWAPLKQMAIAHANAECRGPLSEAETLQFALSLNARNGTLVAMVYGLPHAIAACAEPLEISPEQAKRLGVSVRITDALVAAKKLQP